MIRKYFFLLMVAGMPALLQAQKVIRAAEAYADQKYEKAQELFSDILRKDSSDLAALIGYSKCLLENGATNRLPEQLSTIYSLMGKARDLLSGYSTADRKFISSHFGIYNDNDLRIINISVARSLWTIKYNQTAVSTELRFFINKYTLLPSTEKKQANEQLESLVFDSVMNVSTVVAMNCFEREFPASKFNSTIRSKKLSLEYEAAVKDGSRVQLELFLEKYQGSAYTREIKLLIAGIDYDLARAKAQPVSWRNFKKNYEYSAYNKEPPLKKMLDTAAAKIEEFDFEEVMKTDLVSSLESFLSMYPGSGRKKAINEKLSGLLANEIRSGNDYTRLPALYARFPGAIPFKDPLVTQMLEDISRHFSAKNLIRYINAFIAEEFYGIPEQVRAQLTTLIKSKIQVSLISDSGAIRRALMQLKRSSYEKEDFLEKLSWSLVSVSDMAILRSSHFSATTIFSLMLRENDRVSETGNLLLKDDAIRIMPVIHVKHPLFDKIRQRYQIVGFSKTELIRLELNDFIVRVYGYIRGDQPCCPTYYMDIVYFLIRESFVPDRALVVEKNYNHDIAASVPNTPVLDWFNWKHYVERVRSGDLPEEAPPEERYSTLIAVPVEDRTYENEKQIFDKVEIEASFPGGDSKWRQYLERNANGRVGTENGAPEGTYTTVVQFVVDKEGNISNVSALTSHGYGMEEEAIRIINKGPKWSPAIQNGRQVKAYRKQPITFRVEADNL